MAEAVIRSLADEVAAASSARSDSTSGSQSRAQGHAAGRALELLHKGVADLIGSEGWRRALAFRSKFHSYSFFNASLILAQKPDATMVAGYRKWQELGRQVKKGEKGIMILAPLIKLDPEKREEKLVYGFRSVYVFDLSQTEGLPVPTLERPKLLGEEDEASDRDGGKGKASWSSSTPCPSPCSPSSPHAPARSTLILQVLSSLASFCQAEGISLSFDLQHPKALGVYRPRARSIALRGDLPPLQTLKTLIHELAHALLHDKASDRMVAELEAESCAFLVCHQLGLDTSAYSFPYLANWTDGLESLVKAGEKASRAAERILQAIQGEMASRVGHHTVASSNGSGGGGG